MNSSVEIQIEMDKGSYFVLKRDTVYNLQYSLQRFCKVDHFADDTNLLCLSNSIKKLSKLVNANLKHLLKWLNANKISLNVKKTEMIIF